MFSLCIPPEPLPPLCADGSGLSQPELDAEDMAQPGGRSGGSAVGALPAVGALTAVGALPAGGGAWRDFGALRRAVFERCHAEKGASPALSRALADQALRLPHLVPAPFSFAAWDAEHNAPPARLLEAQADNGGIGGSGSAAGAGSARGKSGVGGSGRGAGSGALDSLLPSALFRTVPLDTSPSALRGIPADAPDGGVPVSWAGQLRPGSLLHPFSALLQPKAGGSGVALRAFGSVAAGSYGATDVDSDREHKRDGAVLSAFAASPSLLADCSLRVGWKQPTSRDGAAELCLTHSLRLAPSGASAATSCLSSRLHAVSAQLALAAAACQHLRRAVRLQAADWSGAVRALVDAFQGLEAQVLLQEAPIQMEHAKAFFPASLVPLAHAELYRLLMIGTMSSAVSQWLETSLGENGLLKLQRTVEAALAGQETLAVLHIARAGEMLLLACTNLERMGEEDPILRQWLPATELEALQEEAEHALALTQACRTYCTKARATYNALFSWLRTLLKHWESGRSAQEAAESGSRKQRIFQRYAMPAPTEMVLIKAALFPTDAPIVDYVFPQNPYVPGQGMQIGSYTPKRRQGEPVPSAATLFDILSDVLNIKTARAATAASCSILSLAPRYSAVALALGVEGETFAIKQSSSGLDDGLATPSRNGGNRRGSFDSPPGGRHGLTAATDDPLGLGFGTGFGDPQSPGGGSTHTGSLLGTSFTQETTAELATFQSLDISQQGIFPGQHPEQKGGVIRIPDTPFSAARSGARRLQDMDDRMGDVMVTEDHVPLPMEAISPIEVNDPFLSFSLTQCLGVPDSASSAGINMKSMAEKSRNLCGQSKIITERLLLVSKYMSDQVTVELDTRATIVSNASLLLELTAASELPATQKDMESLVSGSSLCLFDDGLGCESASFVSVVGFPAGFEYGTTFSNCIPQSQGSLLFLRSSAATGVVTSLLISLPLGTFVLRSAAFVPIPGATEVAQYFAHQASQDFLSSPSAPGSDRRSITLLIYSASSPSRDKRGQIMLLQISYRDLPWPADDVADTPVVKNRTLLGTSCAVMNFEDLIAQSRVRIIAGSSLGIKPPAARKIMRSPVGATSMNAISKFAESIILNSCGSRGALAVLFGSQYLYVFDSEEDEDPDDEIVQDEVAEPAVDGTGDAAGEEDAQHDMDLGED
jgi:hypothetical protein